MFDFTYLIFFKLLNYIFIMIITVGVRWSFIKSSNLRNLI